MIKFTKMHALGNDFILIDVRMLKIQSPGRLARKLCQRRFGIGADQVLLLEKSAKADFGMRIFNADGSEVEMCGNGIRALAKYIWDRGLSSKEELEIETPAGIIRPSRQGDMVRVDMGEPVLEAKKIPVNLEHEVIGYPVKAGDRILEMTCVSMGNPHAVIFVDDAAGFQVADYGPLIENNPLFPKRTNVEFIEVLNDRELRMRVWERGAGETPACGTGASAAVVAASLKGLAGRKVTVHLEGGDLLVEWADNNRVYMTGPATEVFDGEIKT